MDLYRICCTIQIQWLAARVEDIGFGWVSIQDHGALKYVRGVLKRVSGLADRCIGDVSDFVARPDLETAGQ